MHAVPAAPRGRSNQSKLGHGQQLRLSWRVGITERATHRIVTEPADAGYITRQRNGRRNHYTINTHFPLPDPVAREQHVGQLLEIFTATQAPAGESIRRE